MASIEQSIEVNVPVRTAYNQWTQFEEFPRFMDGVESVRQLDDKRLHWKATVAGKVKEWDAEITEQTPDQRIAWTSRRSNPEPGWRTRGTASSWDTFHAWVMERPTRSRRARPARRPLAPPYRDERHVGARVSIAAGDPRSGLCAHGAFAEAGARFRDREEGAAPSRFVAGTEVSSIPERVVRRRAAGWT